MPAVDARPGHPAADARPATLNVVAPIGAVTTLRFRFWETVVYEADGVTVDEDASDLYSLTGWGSWAVTLTHDGAVVSPGLTVSASQQASSIITVTVPSTLEDLLYAWLLRGTPPGGTSTPLLGGTLVVSTGTTDTPDGSVVAVDLLHDVTVEVVNIAAGGTGGGGAVASVNGQTGVVVLDPDDLDDATTTHKFATAAELAKLAGIEAGATADQTAGEILAALLGVDGPGSGLNADLLDGNEAAAFQTAAAAAAHAGIVDGTAHGINTLIAAAVAALINAAPGALDTLDELAAAMGDDANFVTTVTNALAGKQPLDADLTAIAALSTTAWGRALLVLADAAAARTALDVDQAGTAATLANAKVADAINNGTTTVAPSQNAVFDALALKADASAVDPAGDAFFWALALG